MEKIKCTRCKSDWNPNETDKKSNGLFCKTCKNVENGIKMSF